jgi:hyperosmotically inducible periplasmic protein
MIKINRRLILASLAIAFSALESTASAQQGPIGQGINDAGRAVKRGFQTAGQAVSGSFQKTRTTVHNMEVVSRVYSRLHWDKALTSSSMEIEVQAGGVAILTGLVPTEEARTKALALTSETVGVNRVVDQLTVAAPGTPAPVVPGTPPTVVPSGTIIVTPPPTVVVPPATPKPRETDTPL